MQQNQLRELPFPEEKTLGENYHGSVPLICQLHRQRNTQRKIFRRVLQNNSNKKI